MGVKPILCGLAVLALMHAATVRAADAADGWLIEQAGTAAAPPLGETDMQRLAAGKPPRVYSRIPIGGDHKYGLLTYRCSGCNGVHSTNPSLDFRFTQDVAFTTAMVKPHEAQGFRILRGPDGAIQQAADKNECYFVKSEGKSIVVERYLALDCRVAVDGRMEPLPDAKFNYRIEAKEISSADKPNTRTFETKRTAREKGKNVISLWITELEETQVLVQTSFCYYLGDKPVPEAMAIRDVLQRVIAKDHKGYKQIIKNEKVQDGGMVVNTHAIEDWAVKNNGERFLVNRQVLAAPPEANEPADSLH